MKLMVILLLISSSSFANCRYSIVEQNGTYFVIKRVLGELPTEKQKIKDELKIGNNDVEILNSEDEDNPEEKSKARVKVRFQSKDKEEAQKYLKRFCP